MAFQKVRVLEADSTISLGKTDPKTGNKYPTSVEGYYLGTKKVQTDNGESTIHHFETQSGVVGVWGTTKLNSGLSQVTLGNMTRATFVGLGKPTKGRQPARLFDIQQDPDNSIDVLPSSSMTSQYDDGDNDNSYEDQSLDEDDSMDKNAAQQAALAAAERKAVVFAQLKAKGLKK